MRFEDHFVNRDERYSLGRDLETGGWYLSIAVSSSRVDYEEYYAIDLASFEEFLKDADKAKAFAACCGRREMDSLLILRPAGERGVY